MLLAACSGGSTTAPEPNDGLTIVATTSIIGGLVEDLVGDDATVTVLIGAGVDPHGYAASAAVARDLRQADLVVTNGLGLEASLADTLDAAIGDGANVLELGPLVDPRRLPEGVDPHFWLDPERVAEIMGPLGEAIATADIDGTVDWAARAAAAQDELADIDAEVSEILAVVQPEDRVLVTNHDAFGYFADRYGFEVIATLIPGTSTQADPSAGSFSQLAALIRDRDVPAIFTESSTSPRLAEALAEEVGRDVTVVTLFTESLGDAASGADGYRGLMTTNARAIADALTTGASR